MDLQAKFNLKTLDQITSKAHLPSGTRLRADFESV